MRHCIPQCCYCYKTSIAPICHMTMGVGVETRSGYLGCPGPTEFLAVAFLYLSRCPFSYAARIYTLGLLDSCKCCLDLSVLEAPPIRLLDYIPKAVLDLFLTK